MKTLEQQKQRAVLRRKREDKRYLAVLRDPQALVDGWMCPVCGNDFKDQYACEEGWDDVEKANNKFLLNYMRRPHANS